MAEFPSPGRGDIEYLQNNPDLSEKFNKKFGPGAAEKVLNASDAAVNTDAEASDEPGTLTDMARGAVSGVENAITETASVVRENNPGNLIERGIEAVTGVDPVTDVPEDAEVDFGGKKPVTMAGKITEGIVQFTTGLAGFKGLGGALTAGTKGTLAAGAAADAFSFAPDEGNLSTFMEQNDWAIPIVTEAMATDPEDPEWINRVRNAAEGLALGGIGDLFFRGLRATALGSKAKRVKSDELAQQAQKEAAEAAESAQRMLDEGVDIRPEANATPEPFKRGARDSAGETTEEVVEETAPAAGRGAAKTTEEVEEATLEAATEATPRESFVDVEKLREAVSLRDAVTPDDLAGPDFRWMNFDKLTGPVEGKKLMVTVGDALEEAGALKAFNADKPKSLAKTREDTSDEVALMVGEGVLQFERKMARLAEETKDMDTMITTAKVTLQGLGREIDKLATKIDVAAASGMGQEELDRKLISLLQTSANLQAYLKASQTAGARATSAGRIPVDDAIGKEALDTLEAYGGPEKIRQLAKTIRGMGGDPARIAAAARAAAKGPDRFDAFLAYRMANMLSGFTTQSLNITANAINMAVRPGERIIGGAIDTLTSSQGGGRRQSREGLSQYGQYFNMREVLIPSIRMAGRTIWNDRQVLDNITKFDTRTDVGKALSPEVIFGMNQNNPLYSLAKFATNVEGLPLRALGTADEGFKQIAFRARLRAKLMQDATEADLESLGYSNTGEYVEDNFKKAFNRLEDLETEWNRLVRAGRVEDTPEVKKEFIDANLDSWNPGSNVAVDAIREARAATFTTPLEPGSWSKWVETGANNHRWMRLVAPFIRTPVNVLSEAWQRSPGIAANIALDHTGKIQSKFARDLKSADPAIRAEAKGKLATGAMLTLGAMWAASEGRLTGHGPVDGQLRDVYRKDPNWQPASLNIGTPEEPQWVQLNRGDPWTWNLVIAADIYEMHQAAEEDPSQDLSTLTMLAITSMANNITNKTWMQGVSGLFEVMYSGNRPWVGERFAQGQITSLMPLGNLGRQLNQQLEPHRKEIDGVVAAMKQSIPGMTSDMPTRYNWFSGEPIDNPSHLFGYLKYKSEDRDWVAEELKSLRYPFLGPERKIRGFELTSEQFQEWNRLMGTLKDTETGLTLREALAERMKSGEYDRNRNRFSDQISEPTNNPRVELLRPIFSRYKKAARDLMLDRNSDLKQDIREHEIYLKDAYQGNLSPGQTNPLLDQ